MDSVLLADFFTILFFSRKANRSESIKRISYRPKHPFFYVVVNLLAFGATSRHRFSSPSSSRAKLCPVPKAAG